MSINIEQTFQAGSTEDLKNSVEMFDEDDHTLDNVSESHSASEDIEYNPYLEWAVSWSDYVEEMLAEKERDLALDNGDSREDWGASLSEFDWNATPISGDSWPQSDDSWERQPMVSFADEYEARMAALDQEAENALNTGAKRSPDAPAPVILIDTLEKLDKSYPSSLGSRMELSLHLTAKAHRRRTKIGSLSQAVALVVPETFHSCP
ncbi:hypothetical protein BCON_0123g00030 [Botryotinia convoluta]|uniref:Uncharacterized protein n=1 Tax=Botryotinia convoluta TaxID=54673 RepID=A0A4Z1HVZ3_9HELO|nr:hypothetical protein BCON_0123g00030 [Botryotinia convoluta]